MTTITLPRARTRGSQVIAALIVAVGHVIGFAHRYSRLLPGLAGAAVVSYGASMVYLPAGVILGGLFLLSMDRQIQLPSRGQG